MLIVTLKAQVSAPISVQQSGLEMPGFQFRLHYLPCDLPKFAFPHPKPRGNHSTYFKAY